MAVEGELKSMNNRYNFMKNLIIIGARAFGREVYCLAIESLPKTEYKIKGFLDDNENALADYSNYPNILSSVEDYVVESDDVFVCALGDVAYKKKYVDMIKQKGGAFISIIHPNAIIRQNTCFGEGCIIAAGCQISCDVKVGNVVTLQPNVFLGHNVNIGDYTHINTNAVCNGNVLVDDMVTLHTASIIAPNVKVGENTIVGAGSIVLCNIKSNVTVLGNPAKIVFER